MSGLISRLPIALVLLVTGCAYKYQPIYNVDRPMPAMAAHMSLDRIRDTIVAVGIRNQWTMRADAPGHLVASQDKGKYSATTDIYFSQTRLAISLKTTVHLNQTATTVHSHYNVWIKNLESQILSDLSTSKAAERPQ